MNNFKERKHKYDNATQRYHVLEEMIVDDKGRSHIPRTYLCSRTDNQQGDRRIEGRTGLTRVYLD